MRFGKRTAIVIISVMALISVVMVYFVTRTNFNYDFEQFFPEHEPATKFYKNFKDTFGSDNDFIIIAVEARKKNVFDSSYLTHIDSIVTQIERTQKIKNIRALTNMSYYVRDQFMGNTYKIPYLKRKNLKEDSTRIFKAPNIVGSYINKEASALALIVQHKKNLEASGADTLLNEIDHIITKNGNYEYHKVGGIVGHNFYVNIVKRELYLFVGLSVILIVLFLIISFRSWSGIYIPLIVVSLSVIWDLGLMGILGKDLNIILNIIPTILMVVGISGVVHILTSYLDQLKIGLSKMGAIQKTYRDVGRALILTSLTTIVGFVTLTTSDIRPVIDFGLITAAGVFITFLFTIFMMRSILTLLPKLSENRNNDNNWWRRNLGKLYTKVLRTSWSIIGISVIILGISIWGSTTIITNKFVMENLDPDHPLKKDYNYVEENFSGARPFEMAVMIKSDSVKIWDYRVMQQLDTLEYYLQEEYGVGSIISPTTPVKTANVANHAGNKKYYRIPESKEDYQTIKQTLQRYEKKERYDFFLNETEQMGRISGKMHDVGSKVTRKINPKLKNFITENLDTTLVKYRITGAPHVMEINNDMLTTNVFQGLIIAFAIISIIVGFLYRSIIMVALSLVPNVLPLVIIGGIMGFSGIYMNMSTSLIFAIVFGIAVDDTIHFLSKFKIEMDKGYNKVQALRRTFIYTGKAIIFTSLILSGGFLTLALSDFSGTAHIGILVSISLGLALILDLTLLPVMLMKFYPARKYKRKKGK